MVAVSLGLMLGQGVLIWRPELDFKPLLIVAICFAACLLAVTMIKRLPPAKLVPRCWKSASSGNASLRH